MVTELERLPITRVPHGGLLIGAWDRRANLSAYDAVYVALASKLRCALLTADARIVRGSDLGIPVTLVPASPG